MTLTDLPSTAAFLERLRALAPTTTAADLQGQLQPEQTALIHDSGWLRMLAPQNLGGHELALPDMVRLEEAIACIDGSCAWVVTLCAGAGWFTGFLPPQLGQSILNTPQMCLAGSGAPTGQAERHAQGWRLKGQWRHATGSQLATHYTFNAQLRDKGQALLDDQGRPRTCAFVVAASQVEVVADSWHSMGLRASTSGAFALNGVWVPDTQAFVIDARHATASGPLYRFPFEALACVTLAACMLGMARHFMALAQPLVSRHLPSHDGPSAAAVALHRTLDQSLQVLRLDFYGQLDAVWQTLRNGEDPTASSCEALSRVARALARQARESVDALYPCCGLHAADPRSEINRVWRDLHTASQHAIWLR